MNAISTLVRLIQCTTVILLMAFAKLTSAAPLPLSDDQLDTITAGYVNLYGHATAEAFGDIAIADIYVDTAQTITHTEDGLTYTISTVTANAAAIGETVETAVAAGFDTDEQILSLDIAYSSESGLADINLPALAEQHSIPSNSHHAQKEPTATPPQNPQNSSKQNNRKRSLQRKPGKKNSNRNRHKNKAGKHRVKKRPKPIVYQNKSITLRVVTVQPTI